MGGEHRVDGVGGGSGQAREHPGDGQAGAQPSPAMGCEGETRRRGQPQKDDRRPQPGVPAGAAAEQDVRADDGRRQRRGEDEPPRQLVPPRPQGHDPHAHDGADRRCEGHRVVRMDDPAREADDGAADEQHAAP